MRLMRHLSIAQWGPDPRDLDLRDLNRSAHNYNDNKGVLGDN